MAPLFVNLKCFICAKNQVTEGALVGECVWEVDWLNMVPHIGDVEDGVLAKLTSNPSLSIISDDVLLEILWTVDSS